jgi:hypothetical protein
MDGAKRALVQQRKQHGQHTLDVTQHIVVPEPLHEEIVRSQPAISLLVVLRLRMLAAIDFDDETSTEANEVTDERAERNLPSEFEVNEAPITQSEPQLALGIGHL